MTDVLADGWKRTAMGAWEELKLVRAERDALRAENARLREALQRLADCNWTITLPDRMDAVRTIAREALSPAPG